MDCARVRAAVPRVVPSIAMPYEDAASRRDMVTFTRDDDELPGQSTLRANRVEITKDPDILRLRSPGADVPLKQETRPRSRDASPSAWARTSAPVAAARMVTIGAVETAVTGGTVRGAPARCPNAAPFTSIASVHVESKAVSLALITKPGLTENFDVPVSVRAVRFAAGLVGGRRKSDGVRNGASMARRRYRHREIVSRRRAVSASGNHRETEAGRE